MDSEAAIPTVLAIAKWLRGVFQRRPRLLLIVEDNPTDAELLGMLIKRTGNQFDVAHSSEEAMALVSAKRYAVAFVDIRLNGPTGWDVLRRLRVISPHTFLVAVPGVIGDLMDFPTEIGIFVIRKPVGLEQVSQCLRMSIFH